VKGILKRKPPAEPDANGIVIEKFETGKQRIKLEYRPRAAEFWVNVYEGYRTGAFHSSRALAEVWSGVFERRGRRTLYRLHVREKALVWD
jgi:hypothetical protein